LQIAALIRVKHAVIALGYEDAGNVGALSAELNKMSNSYAAVSALIFALVAVAHVLRLVNRWTVAIGPYNVSMNVSWAALFVSALIAIWRFMQLPL
jgi:hypothetical protein